MSRCYPYPPPGYQKKAAQPVAEIIPAPQATTAHKEKHKHKDKDKDKKKKRKREDSSKDENAHKERRSSKNQKAAPVNDAVGVAHTAENGKLPEPSAAVADNGQGKADRKPVEAVRAVQMGVGSERGTPGRGGAGLPEGKSLQEARILSSEREAGKAGTRGSAGKPSSSSSTGKGDVQEIRAKAASSAAPPEVKAAVSRSNIETRTGKDVRAGSSFEATRTYGKDGGQETKAAVSRGNLDVRTSGPSGRDGAQEAKAAPSRGDARSSGPTGRDGGEEVKASVSKSSVDVRNSTARDGGEEVKASVSKSSVDVRNSAARGGAQEAKAYSAGKEKSKSGLQEARKHGSDKSSKKRDHMASSSKNLVPEKEINGKVSPLITAKPLDTGQGEELQQRAQIEQVEDEQHQQQQRQQKSSGEAERSKEPKRLKLPDVAAELSYGDDYLDWLFSNNRKAAAPEGEENKKMIKQEEQQVWADALYLPAFDLYALPYVVPD